MQFDKDLNSEHAELFLSVRQLVLDSIGDGAFEKESKCIPSYFSRFGGICYIKTEPHGVRIGWFRGIRINDKYKLLSGKGKTLRGHTLGQLGKKEIEAVRYYVSETILTWVEDNLKKGKIK